MQKKSKQFIAIFLCIFMSVINISSEAYAADLVAWLVNPTDLPSWTNILDSLPDNPSNELKQYPIPESWVKGSYSENHPLVTSNMFYWGPKNGLMYTSTFEYGGTPRLCTTPSNANLPGHAINPKIVTDPMISNLAFSFHRTEEDIVPNIYLRSALIPNDDYENFIYNNFTSEVDGGKYYDMFRKYRSANNDVLSFPLIHVDEIKPIDGKLTKLKNGEVVVIYKIDFTVFKDGGNGVNAWGNGPLQPATVQSKDGSYLPPAYEKFERGHLGDFLYSAKWVYPGDADATQYDLDPSKSEIAVVFPCTSELTKPHTGKLGVRLREEIAGNEGGQFMIAYSPTGNAQGSAFTVSIEYDIELTFNPIKEPCKEYCEPGQPTDPGNLGKDPSRLEEYGDNDCKPPEKKPECEEGDCDGGGGGGGDCPGGVQGTPKVEKLRWYNLPLAYAETKDGKGYKQFEETNEGKFTLSRGGEEFEAMMGVPETEKLYINGGGTEGQMDVEYEFQKVKHTFVVCWDEIYVCGGHSCGEGCTWYHHRGTEKYSRSFTHEFRFLHLVSAHYRTPDKMVITNPDLYQQGTYTIDINTKIEASHKLNPDINPNGFEAGPGTGSSDFNHGAEESWQVNVRVGPYTIVCDYPGPLRYDQAKDEANAKVGKIFAQNDELRITIGGEEYLYAVNNKKETDPFGNESPLYAAIGIEDFKPMNYPAWHPLLRVPTFGYNGEPETDAARNEPGTTGNNKPWIKEDIEIVKRQVNGIYDFEKYEEQNYLSYGVAKEVKGGTKNLHSDISEIKNDILRQMSDDVKDVAHYLAGDNQVKVQYTNWQSYSGSHSGSIPDGNRDKSYGDNPDYFSVNPVLIHNPTPAIYARISDIPQNQLQDQRIVEGYDSRPAIDGFKIQQHKRAIDPYAPARQYIDFDFKLYIPNDGPFESYWEDKPYDHVPSYVEKPSTYNDFNFGYGEFDDSQVGIVDPNEVSPGVRGKGYIGTPQTREKRRSWKNPYKTEEWRVEKWINSKYVKFPYDVYYYKNSGETGGSPAGFYDAGTWIQLYDDEYKVKVEDPVEFNFHMASHQKDIKDGEIQITVENINAQEIPAAGKGEELFKDGEFYINGKRDKDDGHYTAIGGKSLLMSASHSANNAFVIDAIGRIGNSIIDDSTDPAWKEVYWQTANGEVDTTKVVSMDYAMYHNMFEQTGSTPQKYNRYGSLEWHNDSRGRYWLPMMANPLPLKNKQVQKLGYETGHSVQTLGDHDGSMMVYPRHSLVGNFVTGDPKLQPFHFYAKDPFDPSGKVLPFYDSRVQIGITYTPQYKYPLVHSLIDTRGKMSALEKETPSYLTAVSEGSNRTWPTGTPSWIQVTRPLRTWIGTQNSTGYLGEVSGVGSMQASNKSEVWENVQKWNFRFSLPRNMQIIFNRNLTDTSSPYYGQFEGRTKNQYIYTGFLYRTWEGFPHWDLTTWTNTNAKYKPQPDNINPEHLEYPPDIPDPDPGNPPSVYPGDISVTPPLPAPIEPDYEEDCISKPIGDSLDGEVGLSGDCSDNDNPETPQVIVDYSNPSSTDRRTIGTH